MSRLPALLAEHQLMILSICSSQLLDKTASVMINSAHPFPHRIIIEAKAKTIEDAMIKALDLFAERCEQQKLPPKKAGKYSAEDVL